MNINQLVGRRIHVVGADPDLFASRAAAVIREVDANTQSLLLEFIPASQIGVMVYPFAVASPRLQRDDLKVLVNTGTLGCGITCVPRERHDPAKPFDLSWWRGGAAAIADLVM